PVPLTTESSPPEIIFGGGGRARAARRTGAGPLPQDQDRTTTIAHDAGCRFDHRSAELCGPVGRALPMIRVPRLPEVPVGALPEQQQLRWRVRDAGRRGQGGGGVAPLRCPVDRALPVVRVPRLPCMSVG